MKFKVLNFLLAVLLLIFSNAYSQVLPRRFFMGAVVENNKQVGANAIGGVVVKKVLPTSTAAMAGLVTDDIIISIGKTDIHTVGEFNRTLQNIKGEPSFDIAYYHQGALIKKNIQVVSSLKESLPGIKILYDQVQSKSGLLRIIISLPLDNKKHPAIVYLAGAGCYSVDTPNDTTATPTELVNTLAKNGIIGMRVDRSGVGDSKGTPCDQIDFSTEVEEYEAAVNKLKSYVNVDSNRVFLFGHSMGGIIATRSLHPKRISKELLRPA